MKLKMNKLFSTSENCSCATNDFMSFLCYIRPRATATAGWLNGGRAGFGRKTKKCEEFVKKNVGCRGKSVRTISSRAFDSLSSGHTTGPHRAMSHRSEGYRLLSSSLLYNNFKLTVGSIHGSKNVDSIIVLYITKRVESGAIPRMF